MEIDVTICESVIDEENIETPRVFLIGLLPRGFTSKWVVRIFLIRWDLYITDVKHNLMIMINVS
jgi:hypothetical protein